MSKEPHLSIPAHLNELLQPTPSGMTKLIAAWDGLTPERQILILTAMKRRPVPIYLYHQLIEKALKSDNAYIRYLAVRDFYFSDDDEQDKALKERIENDPDPLVRYSTLESDFGIFDEDLKDPKRFFELPHDARLAKMRRLTDSGETIASLITHAVEHELKDGKVSESELLEILTDYLNKQSFGERYGKGHQFDDTYDGFALYLDGKDIDTLWELVPKVPEVLSQVLIKHLPEAAGLSSEIPAHVIKSMNDNQLTTLLGRTDIGLEEMRKQIFFRTDETTEEGKEDEDKTELSRDILLSAAIRNNFDLSNKEFAQILAKPDKQRVRDLKDLSFSAQDLRLCLYDAIHDALFVSDVSPLGDDYQSAWDAKQTLERKLKELKGWQRKMQLMQLKLYRLAEQAVPWKKGEEGHPPSGELAFLEDAVVKSDTWATFMAFSNEWDNRSYQTKRLEKHLPKIWEAGEEDDIVYDEDDVDDSEGLADRVANRLSALLTTASSSPEDGDSELVDAVSKLTAYTTVAQERAFEAVDLIKRELVELRQAHTKHRVYMFIVIGLLVLLLFAR